ncbi:MAG: hypothetical protein NVS1B11_13490 [Terriglobales bacterium]
MSGIGPAVGFFVDRLWAAKVEKLNKKMKNKTANERLGMFPPRWRQIFSQPKGKLKEHEGEVVDWANTTASLTLFRGTL